MGGHEDHLKGYLKGKARGGALMYASIDCEDNELHDGKTADVAIDYLLNQRDKNKPFIICAGFSRPHMPWVAPKKYFDMYPEDAGELAMVPDGVEKVLKKKDITGFVENWNEGVTDSMAQRLVRAYMAVTTYADAQMGRIIEALKQTGEYENTIIVMWGDHGYHLTDHGMWRKNTEYRVSLRCPLIIKAPGYKEGKVCNNIVQNIDLYPTFLSLCGVPKPEGVSLHGNDLSPLLKNPKAKWNNITYTCARKRHGLVTDKYRFAEIKPGKYELYDIINDPEEWNNLAGDPKYESLISGFKNELEQVKWNKK
jgi:uncharacterized sulfatase